MSCAQTALPTPLRPAVAMATRGGAPRAAREARSGAWSGVRLGVGFRLGVELGLGFRLGLGLGLGLG